jgi:hypothetical protein
MMAATCDSVSIACAPDECQSLTRVLAINVVESCGLSSLAAGLRRFARGWAESLRSLRANSEQLWCWLLPLDRIEGLASDRP